MSAVVTGATGFLGRRLVRLLREDGMLVTCLVRPGSDPGPLRHEVGEALWDGVEIRPVDLMDERACREALVGCSLLFHLAAGLSGSPSTLFLNSVVPTRRLVAAAHTAHVQRFVLVSSLGVYGTQTLRPGDVVDETVQVDPLPHRRDPYSFSKIVQERVTWEAHGQLGLPLVVVRPGVIMGPGRGVVSNRIGVRLGPCLLRMGGGQQLPYTYVDNCAAAVRQAGLVERINGEVFNVVDDDLPTARELVRRCRRAGRPVRSLWVPRPLIQPLCGLYEWYHHWSEGQLPGVITRYRSDAMWKPLRYSNQKAKTLLHWRPEVPFDEAFHRSLSVESAG